jgi:hypothetical protein
MKHTKLLAIAAVLLDQTQKIEVERILEAQHAEMIATHEELRNSGTRPTREQMEEERARSKQELLTQLQPVLTPDQLKKFEALMDRPPPVRMRREQQDGASE